MNVRSCIHPRFARDAKTFTPQYCNARSGSPNYFHFRQSLRPTRGSGWRRGLRLRGLRELVHTHSLIVEEARVAASTSLGPTHRQAIASVLRASSVCKHLHSVSTLDRCEFASFVAHVQRSGLLPRGLELVPRRTRAARCSQRVTFAGDERSVRHSKGGTYPESTDTTRPTLNDSEPPHPDN